MTSPTQQDSNAAVANSRRIVDAPIRMFHALFVLAFFGAFFTAEVRGLRPLHATLGYVVIGLLAFRVVYGMVGPPQARLSVLWRKLAGAPAWLRSLGKQTGAGATPWQQGQNLLMALLIAALIVLVVPLTVSGYGVYHGWREVLGRWIKEVHEVLGNGLFALALGHIALVVVLSLLRKRNMPLTMVTGRTAGRGPDLVKAPRTWLALLMLLACLGFVGWQWQQTPGGLVNSTSFKESKKRKEKHSGLQSQTSADARGDNRHDDDD